MTVIILEGPDGSGKTTLALKIAEEYEGAYIKSPAGKGPGWSPSYDYWASSFAVETDNPLFVLDRTPEISELIYGSILRGGSRLTHPAQSIYTLAHKKIMVIFCTPPYFLEGEHLDPSGNRIDQKRHLAIKGGYKVVKEMVKAVTKVGIWDYHQPEAEPWVSFVERNLDVTP